MAFVLSSFVPDRSHFCALGRLCFVTVAFPGYVHLYFHKYLKSMVTLSGVGTGGDITDINAETHINASILL